MARLPFFMDAESSNARRLADACLGIFLTFARIVQSRRILRMGTLLLAGATFGAANLAAQVNTNIFGGTVAGQSKSVTGIPTTGATLYARLYSLIAGAWQYVDYTYTEQ